MKITKTYSMKAGSIEENCLKGTGNVMGKIDRGNDLVFPGFFKDAIPGFLKSGFMPVGHDWSGLPIAMPVKAAEQGSVLYCEFEFHSTERAQEARIVAKERMDKGLDVGLSVGFDTTNDGISYFTSGAKALEHARSLGCDMSLFDTNQVGSHKGVCRALLPGGCKELYEISYVTVPMSTGSNASSVKADALGETAEASAAIAAISDLTQTLMGCLYSCLYGWDNTEDMEPTAADQIAQVTPMFDEWRDTAVRIITALITDEEASEEAKSLLFSLTRRSQIKTVRDFERFLREAGFTRKEQPIVATQGFKGLLRDAGEPENPSDTFRGDALRELARTELQCLRMAGVAL